MPCQHTTPRSESLRGRPSPERGSSRALQDRMPSAFELLQQLPPSPAHRQCMFAVITVSKEKHKDLLILAGALPAGGDLGPGRVWEGVPVRT